MTPCTSCGASLTLGASDCASCGKPVRPEQATPVAVDTLEHDAGMLANLWRGNYALPRTYWVFGVLGGICVALLYFVAVSTTRSPLVALVGLVAIWIWQVFISVAIWRSAGKFTGAKAWSVLARVLVVLGFLQLLKRSLDLLGITSGA